MADRHNDRDPDPNRRTFIKTIGAAGALALGGLSAGNAAASSHDVNLADRGLSNGDRIDSYIDGSFSGETVLIPAGEYQWDGSLPSLSDATLRGHPDGVVFNRPSADEQMRTTLSCSGNATLENITIRGKAGSQQSRIDINGASGSHLTLRNVNLPDGSRDWSDSYAFSAWNGSGDITFERCYIGDFGNAACYMEGNGGSNVFRECVFVNGQNAIRPPENEDALIENCVFVWEGDTTHFCEDATTEPATSSGDCSGVSGRMARGVRVKHAIDTLTIRNCRFYQGQGDISYGPSIHLKEEGSANDVTIENCHFYNHGDSMPIIANGSIADAVDASNLYDGGPGAGLAHFSEARAGSWSNPDLSDVSVWHTPDGNKSASVGAADPTPNTPGSSGDDGGDQDPFENRFVVVGATEDADLTYRFWVDGNVSLETFPDSDVVAESGEEEISSQGQLSVVTGTTGDQLGDAFAVSGDVVAFERTGGDADWQLFDDGEDVTDDIPAELPEEYDPLTDRFAVMATTPNEEVQYTFWVDGDASLATDIDGLWAAESGDEQISEDQGYTCITGSTGNEYGDAFERDGEIVAFQQTGGASEYQLFDDGEDVTDEIPVEPPVEDDSQPEDRLVVMATTSGEEVSYRFWVDGDISLDTDADDGTAAEAGDEQIGQEEGYAVVTGSTGNQFGDAFVLDGELAGFVPTGGNSDHELLLGGEAITDDVPAESPIEADDGEPENRLVVTATTSGEEVVYEFWVDGAVSLDTDADDGTASEAGDETVGEADGYTHVTGSTGNQFSDAFLLEGDLVAFAPTGGNSDHELLLGGQDVTSEVPQELPNAGPREGTLLIDGTAAPDETALYTFTVGESVEVDPDRTTVQDGGLPWDDVADHVGQQTVTGVVGNGVDAFTIVGEIESIDVRGGAEYTVEWS